jgi:DNA-binding winged helix-turn-helix (wHTH) protein/tetratricopeptide (TPR) repeat protein
MSAANLLRFGVFELDTRAGELHRNGDLIHLAPQPFKVLELLVRRGGEVLTRAEIRDHVWCDDTLVDFEQGLNFCVRQIREALGDTADAPRFIETLPRRGYRFLMPVTGAAPVVTAKPRALIVLPFRMLRADPETEFLAFSLPEALAGSLSGLRSLVVRSSMAAARFPADAEPQRIATEADVELIVSGTLLRSGSEIRVSTQLTEAATGTLLWSHSAQAPVGDLFQVQDGLTQHIVTSLSLPLSHREQQLLKHDVPSSARAYEYFLRGNQLSYERSTRHSDAKQWDVARDLYEQSVAEDPGYAPAWARLGRIQHVMSKFLPAGTHDGLRQAEGSFLKALELNPDSNLAHKLYAQLEVDMGRGLDAMSRLIERAAAAPDPELLAGLVSACRYGGLLEASAAAHARAVELEPKIRTSVVHTWFMQSDHARVLTFKIPEFPYLVALTLAELGRGREAIPVLKDLERKIPTRVRDYVAAARTLLEGDVEESAAAAMRVAASDFSDPEGLFYLARHLSHLKQAAPAMELMERVVAGGFHCHPVFARDPWLDPLRRKPAFTKLLERAAAEHQKAKEAFARLGGAKVLGI